MKKIKLFRSLELPSIELPLDENLTFDFDYPFPTVVTYKGETYHYLECKDRGMTGLYKQVTNYIAE